MTFTLTSQLTRKRFGQSSMESIHASSGKQQREGIETKASLFRHPMLSLRSKAREWQATRKSKKVWGKSSYEPFDQPPPIDYLPPYAGPEAEDIAPDHHAQLYPEPLKKIRKTEYPNMENGVYLDHSGTTIYARSLIIELSDTMLTNLWGNPHSENLPARRSGNMVDAVRNKALRFLGANPEHYDLVFVANATAGIKLVADALRDIGEKTEQGGFWYGYHSEVHSSLLGVREVTDGGWYCFVEDEDVERWIHKSSTRVKTEGSKGVGLFAYPGQSNLSGRRLPQDWPSRIRKLSGSQSLYTLFDASALAMTSSLAPLFANPDHAPDFTCLSFYKIFGYPDLGALIVRRDSGHILSCRKYFGGGTIAQVFPLNGDHAHRKKAPGVTDPWDGWNIHDGVEDGTLPFHSILALGIAIDTHKRLYDSMDVISKHCTSLALRLHVALLGLKHPNGRPVIELYTDSAIGYSNPSKQGATFAFNVLRPDESYISWLEVEQAANRAGIYIRAGGVCCPGGVFKALQYQAWEWNRMALAGHTCSSGKTAIINRKPTGIVRASLGAMTTEADVEAFVQFLRKTYAREPTRDAKKLV